MKLIRISGRYRAERTITITSKYRLHNIPTRWHCNHQHVFWKFVQMVTEKTCLLLNMVENIYAFSVNTERRSDCVKIVNIIFLLKALHD